MVGTEAAGARAWMVVAGALSSMVLLGACDDGAGDDDDSVADDDDSGGGDDDTDPAEDAVRDLSLSLSERVGSVVVAAWEQVADAQVILEYGFGDDEWLQTPAVDVGTGHQEQLLLGIPYGETVTVHAVWDAGDGPHSTADRTIDTEDLPGGLSHADTDLLDADRWDPATPYLLLSLNEDGATGNPNRTWTLIVDRRGRLVWGVPTPAQRLTLHPRTAADGGTFLIDLDSYWAIFDNGAQSQVQRVTIDGAVVETLDTPGLHHAFTDLPDGSLLWGAIDGQDETIQRLHPDGTLESIWSCGAFHQEIGAQGFCASNTISYREDPGTLLFSFYSTDSIVEIDLDSAEAVRWFGQLPGAWAFDPEDSTFWWQHGGYYTDEGTLLLSSRITEFGDETVVREYELDEGAQTLRQVWSFGVGEGVFASEMGEAHRLPGGNTLHNYGSEPRLREVTPDGDLVWEIHWVGIGRYIGRSTPLGDLYDYLP